MIERQRKIIEFIERDWLIDYYFSADIIENRNRWIF